MFYDSEQEDKYLRLDIASLRQSHNELEAKCQELKVLLCDLAYELGFYIVNCCGNIDCKKKKIIKVKSGEHK